MLKMSLSLDAGLRRLILVTAVLFVAVMTAAPMPNPAFAQTVTALINEFVFNHDGVDTNEYVEIFSAPNTALSLTLVVIEGESSAWGTIDDVISVGTTDADGYWWTGYLPSNTLENGTQTMLLVNGFSGSQGDDLDTDNDGTLDSTPW